MKTPGCQMQGRVDAHFSGTIAPEDERVMRAHLGGCEDCRTRYRRRLVLARLDPQALQADARIGQGLGLRQPRSLARVAFPAAGALLAAAAAVLLLVGAPRLRDGFAARGVVSDVTGATPLHVYRVPNKEEPPVPAVDTVGQNDELAFAYENLERKKYLMIFGVDDHRRVYWFHPGWTIPSENPQAIPIVAEPGVVELPEAVAHRFEGSNLEIHALFLDERVSVRDVERALAVDAGAFPGRGVDHVQRFRIAP